MTQALEIIVVCQFQARQSPDQRLESVVEFEPCQHVAETPVDPGAEGEMRCSAAPLQVEPVGIGELRGIAIGRAEAKIDEIVLDQRDPRQIARFTDGAREELEGRFQPQHFFDEGADERGVREGEGFTLNIPVRAMTAAEDYMRMFEQGLESVMKNFAPDLVLISAGFDAHTTDPLGQLMLVDDSYQRMTKRLKEAARATGKGRVVSCLEGGYNLRTMGETVRTHVAALE